MVIEPDSHLASTDEAGLARDLTHALDDRQFFLVYQPTIDLQTGAFVGVEALLRWRHPDLGIVAPDRFLPGLESTGRIIGVGNWVLLAACRQGADWHSSGHRFTVSVNVSSRQLLDSSFSDEVEHALADSRFDASHLVLEFSEHTLIDGGATASSVLGYLHSLGVLLAIDDFGATSSPTTTLTSWPIDIVKIDRHYIASFSTSAEVAARIHELVQLGKSLNVQTIAQGIEDDDQRLRLQVEDVDVGQGFLFSVPHDASVIDRFLEDFAIFSGKPL